MSPLEDGPRTPPGTVADELPGAGYAWAWRRRTSASAPAEDWAREVFEHAPSPLQWLLVAGWRLGLGLRMGPRRAPDRILGWEVRESSPDRLLIAADSVLMETRNIVLAGEGTVVWITLVRARGLPGRAVWAAARPIHQLVIRRSLRRADRRLSERRAG